MPLKNWCWAARSRAAGRQLGREERRQKWDQRRRDAAQPSHSPPSSTSRGLPTSQGTQKGHGSSSKLPPSLLSPIHHLHSGMGTSRGLPKPQGTQKGHGSSSELPPSLLSPIPKPQPTTFAQEGDIPGSPPAPGDTEAAPNTPSPPFPHPRALIHHLHSRGDIPGPPPTPGDTEGTRRQLGSPPIPPLSRSRTSGTLSQPHTTQESEANSHWEPSHTETRSHRTGLRGHRGGGGGRDGDDNGDRDNGDNGGSRYRLRRSPASHLRHPRAGRVPPGRGPAAAACQGRHFVSRRRRRGEFGERRSPSTAPPVSPEPPLFSLSPSLFYFGGKKIPFSAPPRSLSASLAPILGIPPALPSSRLRSGGKRR